MLGSGRLRVLESPDTAINGKGSCGARLLLPAELRWHSYHRQLPRRRKAGREGGRLLPSLERLSQTLNARLGLAARLHTDGASPSTELTAEGQLKAGGWSKMLLAARRRRAAPAAAVVLELSQRQSCRGQGCSLEHCIAHPGHALVVP